MTAQHSAYSPVLLLLILLRALPVWSAPAQLNEDQVKSAIILNMARYVDWPADAFGSAAAPLGICSLGQSKLITALSGLQGKIVKGHPVTVRHMSGSGDVGGCHLVVVDTADRRMISAVLEKSRRLPVLTVGDIDGFTHEGGLVEFYLQQGKVRFEINLTAARQSRLKFSSQLLKVSRVVGSDE